MNDGKRVLELCIQAGEILLRNGGEIFRVQETMERIAAAYHIDTFHVYVLTNGLFASVDEEGETQTAQIRMVPLSPVHLGRVCAVNELSREITAGKHTVDEAFRRLEDIRRIPLMGKGTQILAAAVGSGCFAFIFGGGFWESVAATAAGALLWVFVLIAGRYKLTKLLTNIVGSAVVTLWCVAAAHLFPEAVRLDRMIIGAIVPLLPGVALTNSIRDFLGGDYLSGTIRLIDALLIAGCIAIGVGLVLKVLSFF